MKTINFLSEHFPFWVVKFSICLNRRVFVMDVTRRTYNNRSENAKWFARNHSRMFCYSERNTNYFAASAQL